jgi:predicted lactoylglutathione lyase
MPRLPQPLEHYDHLVESRISLITLGVSDLRAARAFYEALGWRGQEVQETVFFQAGGMALVLWGREKLAEDSGLSDEHAGSFGGIVLAHNVRSRAEVDAILDAAEEAGATVTRAAAETFYGGYAGVFLDLDGHAWEIAHNPALAIGQDGALAIPDFTR